MRSSLPAPQESWRRPARRGQPVPSRDSRTGVPLKRALDHRPLPRKKTRRPLRRPHRAGPASQAGTTTAEYAIGTLAACGFAAVLYKIVTSASVAALLSALIHKALGSAG